MAGDWIKIENTLPDKPEVWQIAEALKIDADAVTGKLLRIWIWASENCNGAGVTNVTAKKLIDRMSGVKGFADAMIAAGWLTENGNEICFPNFDRHCTKTAKERANLNRRVAKHRNGSALREGENCNGTGVTPVTEQALQKPLPEKRREELKERLSNESLKKGTRSEIIPYPKIAQDVKREAEKICYVMPDETATRFIATYSATGWMLRGQAITDWRSLLPIWKSNESNFKKAPSAGKNVDPMNPETWEKLPESEAV